MLIKDIVSIRLPLELGQGCHECQVPVCLIDSWLHKSEIKGMNFGLPSPLLLFLDTSMKFL